MLALGIRVCYGGLGRADTRLHIGLAIRVEREPALLLAHGGMEQIPK